MQCPSSFFEGGAGKQRERHGGHGCSNTNKVGVQINFVKGEEFELAIDPAAARNHRGG